MKALWDIDQVAERLNTSVRHVRRLVYERRIPYLKIGHFVRFDPDAIDVWIVDRQVDIGEVAPIRGPHRTASSRSA